MRQTPAEGENWPEIVARAEALAREYEVRRLALEGEVGRLEQAMAVLGARESAAREENERVRRELAAAGRDVQRARQIAAQRKRDADQALSTAVIGLRSVREDVERLGDSTAWRVGHRAARAADSLRFRRRITDGAVVAALERIDYVLEVLAARRGEAPPPVDADAPARPAGIAGGPVARDELATRVRDRIGPAPRRDVWPAVSILVLNRNGEALLPALLNGLGDTDYPNLELVVVDHASTDGSIALIERTALPFSVRIEPKTVNLTFAAGCNEAAALAQHPMLLFLNNDIEPFEPGWLKELVEGLLCAEVGAIGATLLRPAPAPGAETPPSGFAVQHRGIRLARNGALARPYNACDGEDLFDDAAFGVETPCVSATGACLLVARESFDRAGGFDLGYRYGLEDVDLGLSLAAAGERVACSGRAVLFHDEGATQRTEGREPRRLNRLVNQRRLSERWGPALRRELRLALARRDVAWVGDTPLHVGIARVSNDPHHGSGDHYTAGELGDALRDLGWQVSYVARRDFDASGLPHDLDVLVALTDDFDARALPSWVTAVAWIRNWTERWLARPWFDRYDILLSSSTATADLVMRKTGRRSTLFPLATNPSRFAPRPVSPDLASDYAFTGHRWGEERALERALAPGAGERLAMYGKGWEDVAALRDHARGSVAYDDLPAVYASTHVVIDDTAGPTLPYDAVNSRVFDALASGTPVITNCARGVHELFDEDFPVWSDGASLRAGLDELLGDPGRRAELGRRYRRQVLAAHTYGHRARTLRDLIVACEQRPSFCLKIGAPSWEQAEHWGDLHLVRDLERALKRRGSRCLVQVLPEWDDLQGFAYDVVVHLKGRSPYMPRPGQFNILWLISHPDELEFAEAEAYDLVCVASQAFADELSECLSVPIAVLGQATDPRRFFPDPDPALVHDLVFVGNSRGQRRRILDDLLPTEHDLAVWGAGWTGMIDERHLRGEWFDNGELRKLYSSAKLVLCDHWDDMRVHGFASNRLYDAVACGAVVVSDRVAGLEATFGDGVLTYDGPDELRAIIERHVHADPARRPAGEARAAILSAHTFDHRAAELMALVHEHAHGAGYRARILPDP